MPATDNAPPAFDYDPESFIAKYRDAAGWGAEYELRLRLLADKTTAIESASTAEQAHVTEEAIIAHFAARLALGEPELMRSTRQLRNKLLHGDLIKARKKLESLGHAPSAPVLRKVELDPALSPLDQILAAVDGGGQFLTHATHPISQNIFGWVMESALDGIFDRAIQSFRKAIAIVNRLSEFD